MNIKGLCQAECADICEYSSRCISMVHEPKKKTFLNNEKEIRFLIDLLRGMPEASVVVAKEKEHFYNVFKRVFGISDLEKKIDELYAEWTGLENDNDQLEQRIEKLEASSAPHTENSLDITELYNRELKWDGYSKYINKTIAELKEQIDYAYRVSEGIDKFLALSRIKTLEKVLRELNQIVKGINYDLNIRKLFGSDIYNHYSERLAENERKLEGGDDMREQGSPDDSNPPNCDKCDRTIEHCVKNECPHRKDDICIDRGILCPAIQKYFTPKEKPPEPIAGSARQTVICPNCMRQFKFSHSNLKLVEKADLKRWYKKLVEVGDPIWEEMEKYLGGE